MPRDGSPAPPSGPAQNKMQSSKKSVRNRCPATVVPSEASYMDLSLHTHTLAEADRDPLPPMAGPALKLVGGSDAHCAPTSQRHDGTDQKAASRLRARIGETVAALRSFPRPLVTEIKTPATEDLFIGVR